MVKDYLDREKTHSRHYMGYSFQLARVRLHAPSHTQDRTYHSLCYTSHGTLAGMKNNSMDPNEGSIRQPIHPRVDTLPRRYISLPCKLHEN